MYWVTHRMFQTAFSMAQHQQQCKLATGVRLLDEVLGGGFERGLSYLLYGSPECTRLLQHSIACALCQVGQSHGIAVIDANNGIRPDVILNYLRTYPLSAPPAAYLNQLHVARAFTTDQLLSLLDDAPDTIHGLNAPILFVHGLMHLLQEEEGGPPSAAGAPPDPRVYRRAQLATHLKQLAFTQQVAVVASADAPKRVSQPPLHIGQTAFHRFHVLIRHTRNELVDTVTLEKHPSRPWQQRSTVSSRTQRIRGAQQTTLFD
jgi:hypothetical protein